WGAGDYLSTYRLTFEALATSGAYDVVALVHDFPFGSPESETALAVALGAEIVASLDRAGGVPVLRGAIAGFQAIPHIAWWERRQAARVASGPVRATWSRLAEDVPAKGYDSEARLAGTARERGAP